MARLDVFLLDRAANGRHVFEIQADVLYRLPTRVVAPLLPADTAPAESDLTPAFDIGGRRFVMLTASLLVLPRSSLRRPIASLLEHHDRVVRALDTLFLEF